jgi:hypothetical protein
MEQPRHRKTMKKNKTKRVNHDIMPRSETTRIHSLMPKEIVPAPMYTLKRRFIATSAVNGNLSIRDLLNTRIVAVTTILGYPIYRAVRLRKISIWTPLTTQGTSVSCTIIPAGIDNGNNSFTDMPEVMTDTTISIDRPAFVSYSPAPIHPAGGWHYSITTDLNLILVICPTGSTMDLTLDCIDNISANGFGYTPVLVAAVVGNQYCRPVIANFHAVGINEI